MSNQSKSGQSEDDRLTERFARDLALARQVQRSFLPQTPVFSGYEFYTHYQPAVVIGGDHLDFVQLPDGRIAVIILDVAGKGVPASLLKARVSGALHAHLLYESDPASVVRKLNTFLCQTGGDRFVTLAVAVLDPASHTLAVVNAGHLPPLLFRPHHGVSDVAPDDSAGLPLGVMPGAEYVSHHLGLQPGECVILITDGVPDAQGAKGDRLGMDRIAGIVHKDYPYSPSGLGHKLLSAVEEHAAGNRQFDDIALVCFGRLV
jgi:serine phosphatase RsbU (regulator of sigma subunit)